MWVSWIISGSGFPPVASDGVDGLPYRHAVMPSGDDGDTAEDARQAFTNAAFEAGSSVIGDEDGPNF